MAQEQFVRLEPEFSSERVVLLANSLEFVAAIDRSCLVQQRLEGIRYASEGRMNDDRLLAICQPFAQQRRDSFPVFATRDAAPTKLEYNDPTGRNRLRSPQRGAVFETCF